MKVTGPNAASTRTPNARITPKIRHPQPAAAASQLVDSAALFHHLDDAFVDCSDCQPRAAGGGGGATGPDDAERYSRTAAWVEEDFHDDGWGDAFAGITDTDYAQLTTPQSTYLSALSWDATTEPGLLDFGLPVGNAAPFWQQQQQQQQQQHQQRQGHEHATGSLIQKKPEEATRGQRHQQNKQPHNPRCQRAQAAWSVTCTAECDCMPCAQPSRQARLDSLTEEMRRFTREHGAYQLDK